MSGALDPAEDDIRLAAYYLWEAEGRPHGRDKDHWFMARETLLRAQDGSPDAPLEQPDRNVTDAIVPGLQAAAGIVFTVALLGAAAVAASVVALVPSAGEPRRIFAGHRGPRRHWNAGRIVEGSKAF